MRGRAFWFVGLAAVLAAGALFLWRNAASVPPPAGKSSVAHPVSSTPARPAPPPESSPATEFAAPAIAVAASAVAAVSAAVPSSPLAQASATPREVAIEDGKTIDFSNGIPMIKDNTPEKAAMENALKAMDDAVKNVTFGPTPSPASGTAPKATP